MKRTFIRFLGAGVGALALVCAQQSFALDAPKGKVVLTITGKVGQKNSPAGAQFDMAMLEAMPQKTFTTNTPWDRLPIKFSGPLLRDVLAVAKAQGTTLQAIATNDYKTSIPVSDTKNFEVVLAHRMNGQLIPLRTKGPLFIVYPFDSKPELNTLTYKERSAWQLKELVVD